MHRALIVKLVVAGLLAPCIAIILSLGIFQLRLAHLTGMGFMMPTLALAEESNTSYDEQTGKTTVASDASTRPVAPEGTLADTSMPDSMSASSAPSSSKIESTPDDSSLASPDSDAAAPDEKFSGISLPSFMQDWGEAFSNAISDRWNPGTENLAAGWERFKGMLPNKGKPPMPSPIPADPIQPDQNGLIVAPVTYASDLAADPQTGHSLRTAQATLYFNDEWVMGDPMVYNHDLAKACILLSVLCNSESRYIVSQVNFSYLAAALGSLGFVDIETGSYQTRSTILDEVSSILNGDTDVVAYAFAHKPLADGTNLVFVGIRGTYGSEWISNFNFNNSDSQNNPKEAHEGFETAEEEVLKQLVLYCSLCDLEPENTRVLATGHSRGGAIANLLAADLDDPKIARDVCARSVQAYTFASPNVSLDPDVHASQYNNIFNIINALDLIPRLPLKSWGFNHYGIDLVLPGPHNPAYGELCAAMQQARYERTGYMNHIEAQPLSTRSVDEVEDILSAGIPTLHDMISIEGSATILDGLKVLDLDLLFVAHYPETYIAWLDVLPTLPMPAPHHS